jgi:chromate transport protein ChrA
MVDWTIISGIIFTFITAVILILLYLQFKKLAKLSQENKKQAHNYGKNVVAGIVSGTVVIIIDRSLTLVFQNPPSIDYTSTQSLIITGSSAFVTILFEAGLILFLVIWIINRGLSAQVEKKEKC